MYIFIYSLLIFFFLISCLSYLLCSLFLIFHFVIFFWCDPYFLIFLPHFYNCMFPISPTLYIFYYLYPYILSFICYESSSFIFSFYPLSFILGFLYFLFYSFFFFIYYLYHCLSCFPYLLCSLSLIIYYFFMMRISLFSYTMFFISHVLFFLIFFSFCSLYLLFISFSLILCFPSLLRYTVTVFHFFITLISHSIIFFSFILYLSSIISNLFFLSLPYFQHLSIYCFSHLPLSLISRTIRPLSSVSPFTSYSYSYRYSHSV